MIRPITLARIERFLKVADWPHSRLGRRAANDPMLISRLRAGRPLTQQTSDQIADFIENYVAQEADRVRKLRDLIR